ncbi:unnamed protein product, partial [Owenia fusiformis]
LYLAALMTLSASSIILTVTILQMHHHDAIYPVPRWLRYFAFEIVLKVVCLQRYKIFSLDEYRRVSSNSENNVSPRLDFGESKDARCNRHKETSSTKDAGKDDTVIQMSDDPAIIDGSAIDCNETRRKEEWQKVAQILDRFLLIVYLVILLIFCVFLFVLPVIADVRQQKYQNV